MAHIYHWKHGWIPLDHEAAHQQDAGIRNRRDAAKAATTLHTVPRTSRNEALADVRAAASQHGLALPGITPAHEAEPHEIDAWSKDFRTTAATHLTPGGSRSSDPRVREAAEVQRYAEHSTQINAFLRLTNGTPHKHGDLTDRIARLDSAMQRSETQRDITVHRYVPHNVAARMAPGSSFIEHGYLSAATRELSSDNVRGFGGSHLIIHVPAKTHFVSPGALSGYPDEHEIILPRGSQLKVLSNDRNVVRLRKVN